MGISYRSLGSCFVCKVEKKRRDCSWGLWWLLLQKNDKAMTVNVTDVEAMCQYCFRCLIWYLEGAKIENEPVADFPHATDRFPLFVTWRKQRKHQLDLRGCIGTFSDVELADGLKEFTFRSAFEDSRFEPIVMSEVKHLVCGVSVLVDFEKVDRLDDWEIGVHGIRIEFPRKPDREWTSATYLPEVASEQGWDHTETLHSLYRKGGYRGDISSDLLASTRMVRYQSRHTVLPYDSAFPSR